MKVTEYFKKYTGKSGSIVDALKSVGVKDPSMSYRKKIAKLNGIENYSGKASQNTKMLSELKKGTLVKSVKEVFPKREKFIGKLQTYQPTIKKYGKLIYYSFEGAESSFAKAKERLKKGWRTGLTCVVPCRWALKDIGIDPSGFYAKNGSFKDCYKGEIKEYTKRLTAGSGCGKTIKQAVDAGLLKPGDIIAFKGLTHTVVYSGDRYFVYDGGRSSDWPKDGILVNYSKHHGGDKISEIIRWVA